MVYVYMPNGSLDEAFKLLRYPIILGDQQKDKKPITLTRMKYGFVVKNQYLIATSTTGWVSCRDQQHHDRKGQE